MTPLTLDDLIQISTDVINYVKIYYPNYYYYFDTLRKTGCRPIEPLISTLWVFTIDGNILFQPLKNNNIRTFIPSDLNAEFVDMIINDDFLFGEHRMRSMLRAFKNANKNGVFQTQNDPSCLYLFRYIKAKELYRDGMTYLEIQNYFGWKNITMAENYVNKVLYK
jgi:hypothetical protein